MNKLYFGHRILQEAGITNTVIIPRYESDFQKILKAAPPLSNLIPPPIFTNDEELITYFMRQCAIIEQCIPSHDRATACKFSLALHLLRGYKEEKKYGRMSLIALCLSTVVPEEKLTWRDIFLSTGVIAVTGYVVMRILS